MASHGLQVAKDKGRKQTPLCMLYNFKGIDNVFCNSKFTVTKEN